MIPIAGSAYTYAYATLGELVAWMIGWDLILEYAVGSMTVAIGWSGYMQRPPGRLRHHACRSAIGAAPPAGIINLPARAHRAADHGAAGRRRPRVGALQRGDGRDQAASPCCSSSPSASPTSSRRTGSRSRRTAGRASWRRPRSCSSPTSASTPSRRPRKRRKNPQRDLPIGIIASLVICTVLVSRRRPGAERHRPGRAVPLARRRAAGRADGRPGGVDQVPQRAGGVRARVHQPGLGRGPRVGRRGGGHHARCCS